jgi:hypothetical protein
MIQLSGLTPLELGDIFLSCAMMVWYRTIWRSAMKELAIAATLTIGCLPHAHASEDICTTLAMSRNGIPACLAQFNRQFQSIRIAQCGPVRDCGSGYWDTNRCLCVSIGPPTSTSTPTPTTRAEQVRACQDVCVYTWSSRFATQRADCQQECVRNPQCADSGRCGP